MDLRQVQHLMDLRQVQIWKKSILAQLLAPLCRLRCGKLSAFQHRRLSLQLLLKKKGSRDQHPNRILSR